MNHTELTAYFSSLDLIARGRTLTIEGDRHTQSSFNKAFLKLIKHLPPESYGPIALLKETSIDEFKSMTNSIYDELVEKYQETQDEEEWNHPIKHLGSGFKSSLLQGIENISQISIVVDGVTGEEYIYDSLAQRIRTDLSVESFWAHFPKKDRRMYEEKIGKSVVQVVFEPHRNETMFSNALGYTCLNKYQKPSWRSKSDYQKPVRFLEYLKHLFRGDKEQMAYVLRWMYQLVYSRNEVALVFNGLKGTGKSLFATLCSSLTGSIYTEKAGLGFGRKEFNTFLMDKILVYIDEVPITKERYSSLKSYFDERQTIEGKGRDPINVRTHTNFIISHNSPNDFYIETSERRFSFMDIAETPLNEVWPAEVLQEFAREISDEESDLIKNIGLYVTSYGEQNSALLNPFEVYKGTTYTNLVHFHLNAYMKTLIFCLENDLYSEPEYVLTHEELRDNIKSACGSEARGISSYRGGTVASMVREYRYREKYTLGEVINPAGDWHFKYNPEVVALVKKEKKENV